MKINEIIKLSEEKTKKVCTALENGNPYDKMNKDIEFIFEYAFDKRKVVWDNCSKRIFEIAETSHEIREKILKIMYTSNIHKKLIIIWSIHKTQKLNNEFFEKIIYNAIIDKNKKLKLFGSQKASSYKLYHFADIIKEESEKTEDENTRNVMIEYYTFLTKGYLIEKSDSEYADRIIFHSGFVRLPKEIIAEEEIHKYVIENLKDRDERINDLYFKK